MGKIEICMTLPVSILTKRLEEGNYENHRRNVITAKASVDNRPPRTTIEPYCNTRSFHEGETKASAIQRENVQLMDRVSAIMGRPPPKYSSEKSTMRMDQRLYDLSKLTQQNHIYVQRLLFSKSVYDRVEMEQDYQRHLKAMCAMSRFGQSNSIHLSKTSCPADWPEKSPTRMTSVPSQPIRASSGSVKKTRTLHILRQPLPPRPTTPLPVLAGLSTPKCSYIMHQPTLKRSYVTDKSVVPRVNSAFGSQSYDFVRGRSLV